MRSKAPTKPTASSTTHIAADTAPRIPPPTMARAQMAVRARATRARATADEGALERDPQHRALDLVRRVQHLVGPGGGEARRDVLVALRSDPNAPHMNSLPTADPIMIGRQYWATPPGEYGWTVVRASLR